MAALGLDTVGLLRADWGDSLQLAGGAALLAVLTAVAASGGRTEGPGITETVVQDLPPVRSYRGGL